VDPTRDRIVEWMDAREADLQAGTPKEPDFERLRAAGPRVIGSEY